MPDVLSNDDLDALAAEYVLGTLDAEERLGATALLEVDHVFRGTVRIWERRLGELHLMVEPVEPDGRIWERIRSKLGVVVQSPAPESVEVIAELAIPAVETVPEDTAGESKPAEMETVTEASGETEKPPAPIVEVAWPEPTPALVPDDPPPRPTDSVPRGAVRPPILPRRGTPIEEKPAARAATGRGWKISTVLAALVAFTLVALIGAWRFFPERLPPQLRATTVLHLPEPPPPPPPRKPPPPPFDE